MTAVLVGASQNLLSLGSRRIRVRRWGPIWRILSGVDQSALRPIGTLRARAASAKKAKDAWPRGQTCSGTRAFSRSCTDLWRTVASGTNAYTGQRSDSHTIGWMLTVPRCCGTLCGLLGSLRRSRSRCRRHSTFSAAAASRREGGRG